MAKTDKAEKLQADKDIQEIIAVYEQAGRDCQKSLIDFWSGVMFGLRLRTEE